MSKDWTQEEAARIDAEDAANNVVNLRKDTITAAQYWEAQASMWHQNYVEAHRYELDHEMFHGCTGADCHWQGNSRTGEANCVKGFAEQKGSGMTLIERLRSVGGLEGTTRYYVNPDGPEAAAEIERLREALKVLTDKCLTDLDGGLPKLRRRDVEIARSALQQKDSK